MSLLITLGRQAEKLDLGNHGAVELTYEDLRVAGGGALLARHRSNRWLPADEREEYATLEIEGPLVLVGSGSAARTLGPYQKFSMFDGVGYVDQRVSAFTDVQNKDWYVHDAGEHWPLIRIVFHRTGP